GNIVSCTALPAAVTLMTDTTWSVGLPSSPAATQVPASFFSRSRPGCVAAEAGAVPGLSSPRTPEPRAISIRPQTRDTNRRVMTFSHEGVKVRAEASPPLPARKYTPVLYRHKPNRSFTPAARVGRLPGNPAVNEEMFPARLLRSENGQTWSRA